MIEIDASLPKLGKRGVMYGLKSTSATGAVTYSGLRFEGDGTIKTSVIARYLSAETRASATRKSTSITPENYRFRYSRTTQWRDKTVYVFAIRPRHKRAGLFKGELWLDAETSQPLKDSGQLVKSPSFFIKRIRFVRVYAIDAGRPAVARIVAVVSTRMVGVANVAVTFRNQYTQSEIAGPTDEP
jgi:hypothetical protein